MEAIYSDVTISMSEFKKNPAAVLRNAKSRPVAVLNHNKAAFYMVEPAPTMSLGSDPEFARIRIFLY
jgi:hypothetical protein